MYQSLLHLVPKEVYWNILVYLIEPREAIRHNVWQVFLYEEYYKYYEKEFAIKKTKTLFWEMCGYHGRLRILQELYARQMYPKKNKSCMEQACRGGHLAIVKWLVEHNKPCGVNALNTAAAKGHMEIVQYLHEMGKPHTDDAMHLASRGGHFTMVKWLFEHGYGGAKKALASAIEEGHFPIVQYLWERGVRTSNYSSYALCSGNLEVVKYLYESQPNGFQNVTLTTPIFLQHLDVAQWLFQQGVRTCEESAILPLAMEGKLPFLQWICQVGIPLPKDIMELAIIGKHIPTIEWVQSLGYKRRLPCS
jgi:hypothetical protein